MTTVLELTDIKKIYQTKNIKTEALSGIHFSVQQGEFISIMGESGAGKTTLNILLNGKNISNLKDSEIASFRRNELGFVFQDFNLLDQFTNKDNIFLPLVLSKVPVKEMKDRLSSVQDRLGIKELLNKYPYEISGGQKQRVAIARAVITKPSLLLADEPTGALDSASSEMILNLFESINRNGQTILMVTHSLRAASYAKRVLFIKDGIVYHELYRGTNENQAEFMERIHQAQLVLSKRGED